jgi:hypothetical protein
LHRPVHEHGQKGEDHVDNDLEDRNIGLYYKQ